jgi:hypothetical protein
MDNSNLDKWCRILLFSCDRKLKNLTSTYLTILEARFQYIRDLETTLTKMGVGDYENSKVDFNRDRKAILDLLGTYTRELREIEKML